MSHERTIDDAIEREKARLRREEAAGQPRPERHPMPTREMAWEAWCRDLVEQKRPITVEDREAFERWWEGRPLEQPEHEDDEQQQAEEADVDRARQDAGQDHDEGDDDERGGGHGREA